ncbi:MAG: 50S ribosomal protein L10 [bacterium]
MPRVEKIAIVEEIAKKIDESKSVYLTDFTGLNVEEISELRRAFRGASVQYQVVKNTLARLSVKSLGRDDLLEYLDGPTAMAFSQDDPAAPARVLRDFAKGKDKPKIKAFIFDGELLGAERLNEIANLPSREALLSQVVGGLKAPLSNLVYSLNGLLNKLVNVLDAVKKQKEES